MNGGVVTVKIHDNIKQLVVVNQCESVKQQLLSLFVSTFFNTVEAKQNSDCVCIENAQTEAKVCIPENCDVIGGSQTKRWP